MATGVFDRLEFLGFPVIDESTSTISTEVQDPHGLPSKKVIKMTDQWQVQFEFSIGGVLALLPAGTFELEVDAESLGNEVVCGTLSVPAAKGAWNPTTQKLDFKGTDVLVTVPVNKIPKEGVYRVMKHLRYTAPITTFKTAAFVEGEDIEFY